MVTERNSIASSHDTTHLVEEMEASPKRANPARDDQGRMIMHVTGFLQDLMFCFRMTLENHRAYLNDVDNLGQSRNILILLPHCDIGVYCSSAPDRLRKSVGSAQQVK